MRLAIMQPYFFPHVAYFQLAAAVDLFVVLDDVTYIKQGWINRNRIQVGGKASWLTVPLAQASSHTLIKDTCVDEQRFPAWRAKFLKTLHHSYHNAPHYRQTERMVRNCLPQSIDVRSPIEAWAVGSIQSVMESLGFPFKFLRASQAFPNPTGLRGVERVLAICKSAGASIYINSAGGRSLYSPERFAREHVSLKFVEPRLDDGFRCLSADGQPMSIIHSLMLEDLAKVRDFVERVDLRA